MEVFELSDLEKWMVPSTFDVLIVEDDETTSRFLKILAHRSNAMARIRTFRTAEGALRYIQDLKEEKLPPPDIAIIDIKLAGVDDGYAVSRELARSFPGTVVAVTSSVEPQDYFKRTDTWINPPLFLPKPFTVNQVLELFECASGDNKINND